jgi:hypothetical protein
VIVGLTEKSGVWVTGGLCQLISRSSETGPPHPSSHPGIAVVSRTGRAAIGHGEREDMMIACTVRDHGDQHVLNAAAPPRRRLPHVLLSGPTRPGTRTAPPPLATRTSRTARTATRCSRRGRPPIRRFGRWRIGLGRRDTRVQVRLLLEVSVDGGPFGCALSAACAASSGRCRLTGPPPGAESQRGPVHPGDPFRPCTSYAARGGWGR